MREKLNTDIIRNCWTQPATRQVNDALYPRVAAGDLEARDEMIHRNMAFVMLKVEDFLRCLPKFRFLRDDLISHGFIGLVDAVDKMAKDGLVEGANPTALMRVCIQTYLGKAVESEETIRIPSRTKRRKAEQGIDLNEPQKVDSIFIDGDEAESIFMDGDDEEDHPFSYDPRPMQNLRETLEACCETEIELEILRLREEGFVDREIAERLSLPLTTTYVMRRTMYARFLQLTGWKGEA